MALHDPVRIFDGFDNLAGGMDGGRNPSLIGRDQCARSTNVVYRGGSPASRPAFRDLTHTHHSTLRYLTNGDFDSGSTGQLSASAFQTGVFQGAYYYSPPGQAETICAMIGGRLFSIAPRPNHELSITEIQLAQRNRATTQIAYMVQADRFLIVQDGESRAIIYDGVTARRSGPDEIVTGTIMAYGMGRLVVTRDQDIYFGDLYGSHEGYPGDSVLKFTENTYLNEGGPSSVSPSLGKLTGLTFTPQQDSSTGDGELLAFAERGVVSFFVSQPRDQWKESAFQRIALLNVGARGHRAMVSINGDVWFRADDGWRSYRQARAEQSGWAHLPMSTEVRRWIEADTPALLDYASAIHFDNRLVGTCTPRPNQGRLYHNGMTALDFDVLSAFGSASKPSWDGHWQKLKVTQLVQGMFKGEHRAFAFAIDGSGHNHIYELTRTGKRDFDGPVSSELVMRSMDFQGPNGGALPYNEKELYGADIWLDEITDSVTMTIDYKPDQHPEWISWQTLPSISPVGVAQAITPGGVPTIRKNFSPRRAFSKPPDQNDTTFTKRLYRRGYEFQPRLRWSGHAALRKFRLHAKTLSEDTKAVVA